ncbi:MAG: alpha/beta hydrolase [Chloroflexota bacterium]
MQKWKIYGLLACVIGLAIASVLVSYLQARVFVYSPQEKRAGPRYDPGDYGLEYESLALATQDGLELAAWYIPAQNRAAVIVVHGYKNTRADVLAIAEKLARHGYGVLMMDLRAHGESDGETLSMGLYEVLDIQAASDYLRQRPDVDAERIGAVGISMGGSIVLLSAAQNPHLRAVVSESAFASLEDEVPAATANTGLPFFLAPLIQRFAEQAVGFTSADVSAVNHIAAISPRPVLILQGGRDLTVSPDSGQRLFDAAGEPRQLWFEPDLGHCTFPYDRPEEYERRIAAFFDQYLLGK